MALPKVKICCISSREEAINAINQGASFIGLVSEMPSGPGVISEELIYEIAQTTSSKVKSVLLTSKTSASDIIDQYHRVKTEFIQLVDEIEDDDLEVIRSALPDVRLMQVIHVTDQKSINKAINIAPLVDYILLDSGNPNAKIKELGGTGRVHNWDISKEIVEKVHIPVFLAGGINEQNVVEAFNHVKPFGLDLCSGVRTDGKLDIDKLKSFFNKVKSLN